MKKEKRGVAYLLLMLSTVFMTFYYILEKLASGGRWGTAMPIAMVDRFLEGKGFYYSVYEQGFESSPTYFPAGTFLAMPIRWIFGINAETVLIAVGIIIGSVCLVVFTCIAVNKEDFLQAGWFALVLYIFCFPRIHFYVGEIHPDIPALCFAGVALLLIEKYLTNKKNRAWKLIGIVITLAISGLFKQNAVFLYAGFGFFLIFTKNLKKKDKIFLLTAELAAGIIVLFIVFLIPGCFEATVEVNANHPKVAFVHFFNNLLEVLKEDYIYGIFICLFFIFLILRKIRLSLKEKMWLAGAIGWTAFGIFGSFKKGANAGNIEAAIISLFPFAIMAFIKLMEVLRDVIKNECWKNRLRVVFGLFVFICAIINIPTWAETAKMNYSAYKDRLQNQQQMTEWLNENYRGSNIAILSHYYFYVCEADVEMTTDFYTTDLFWMAGMASEDKIQKLYEKNQWDVIISMDYERSGPEVYPSVFLNYQLAEDEQIPSKLRKFVYIKK